MVSQETVKEEVSFLPSYSPVLILLVHHDFWMVHSCADDKIQSQIHLPLKKTPYKKGLQYSKTKSPDSLMMASESNNRFLAYFFFLVCPIYILVHLENKISTAYFSPYWLSYLNNDKEQKPSNSSECIWGLNRCLHFTVEHSGSFFVFLSLFALLYTWATYWAEWWKNFQP